MAEKRYYWLKLKEDFFDEKLIKLLRRLPEGDAIVIAYLKLLLRTLKTEGKIFLENILPNQAEEIALWIDEDTAIVTMMLNALQKYNALEIIDEETLYLNALKLMTGSECYSAKRVREHRENKKKALQCNTDVTQCNQEKEIEIDINIYNIHIKDIVDYLNKKTGKSFKKGTSKTVKQIKARLKEDFTVEDFKKVIDVKCEQWLNDSSMSKYLRPETLFGTKFESYLNEAPAGYAEEKQPQNTNLLAQRVNRIRGDNYDR